MFQVGNNYKHMCVLIICAYTVEVKEREETRGVKDRNRWYAYIYRTRERPLYTHTHTHTHYVIEREILLFPFMVMNKAR